MLKNISEYYHLVFNRPYRLKVVVDSGEQDKPVLLLLHGIASDSNTWNQLTPMISKEYRVIALDILGFGASPKPTKQSYNLNCHAKSVLYTIKRLRIKQGATIIGHSMGSLIAVEIARTNPKLANKIIAVSMPIYDKDEVSTGVNNSGLAGKNITNSLFQVYIYLLKNPKTTLKNAQKIMRLSTKVNSFVLTTKTWIPFKKSLQASIMEQNTAQNILKIKIPIYIVYGTMDIFILTKHYKELAKSNNNVKLLSYIGGHLVNKSASKKIVKAIKADI